MAKKLTKSLGAEDLTLAAEGVGEDIQSARNELGEELNLRGLAQAEHILCHHVERGRTSSTLLLEIRQGCGVVGEHRHHPTTERRKESPDGKKNRQKLSVIDGKPGGQGRPLA